MLKIQVTFLFGAFFSLRTARADNPGTALSFVSIKDNEKLQEVELALKAENGTWFICYFGLSIWLSI